MVTMAATFKSRVTRQTCCLFHSDSSPAEVVVLSIIADVLLSTPVMIVYCFPKNDRFNHV